MPLESGPAHSGSSSSSSQSCLSRIGVLPYHHSVSLSFFSGDCLVVLARGLDTHGLILKLLACLVSHNANKSQGRFAPLSSMSSDGRGAPFKRAKGNTPPGTDDYPSKSFLPKRKLIVLLNTSPEECKALVERQTLEFKKARECTHVQAQRFCNLSENLKKDGNLTNSCPQTGVAPLNSSSSSPSTFSSASASACSFSSCTSPPRSLSASSPGSCSSSSFSDVYGSICLSRSTPCVSCLGLAARADANGAGGPPPCRGCCACICGAPLERQEPLRLVTADVSLNDRLLLYRKGGLLSVTSRILVIDLLTGKITPELIDGIVFNHAHKAPTSWNDSFIVRLFLRRNRIGFVKAVTDRPEALSRGFAGLEKVARALMLKRVFLFPRIHPEVQTTIARTHKDYLSHLLGEQIARQPFLHSLRRRKFVILPG
eukprot:GHVT01029536.1.p1 GENE.GHVT01029536.1~~GHVT01029536.1.p1  ORF type:complete len:428 (+),score=68.29 GHVT01029536.1:277-1560(+)